MSTHRGVIPLVPQTPYVSMVSEVAHNQGREKTCYAHACATAILGAERRIVGRKPMKHDQLVKDIISRHGNDGGRTDQVLREECPPRHLRFKRIDAEGEVCSALHMGRHVLAQFHLQEWQWKKWDMFFKNQDPRAIIKREDLHGGPPGVLSQRGCRDEGHVVVIVGHHEAYWTFKNSWGPDWLDEGYARIAKDALKCASCLMFYDIVFFAHELSPQDHHNFSVASAPAQICLEPPWTVSKATFGYIEREGAHLLPDWVRSAMPRDVAFYQRESGGQWYEQPMHPVALGTKKETYHIKDKDTSLSLALKICEEQDVLRLDSEASYKAASYAADYAWFLGRCSMNPTCSPPLGAGAEIKFCHPALANLSIGDKQKTVLLEPWLDEGYCKFLRHPDFHVCPNIDSFFHFCYIASGYRELIWDLQGVKLDDGSFILTDPRFMTADDLPHNWNLDDVFKKHHGTRRQKNCAVCKYLLKGVIWGTNSSGEVLFNSRDPINPGMNISGPIRLVCSDDDEDAEFFTSMQRACADIEQNVRNASIC